MWDWSDPAYSNTLLPPSLEGEREIIWSQAAVSLGLMPRKCLPCSLLEKFLLNCCWGKDSPLLLLPRAQWRSLLGGNKEQWQKQTITSTGDGQPQISAFAWVWKLLGLIWEPLDSRDNYVETCPINSNPDLCMCGQAGVKILFLTAYFKNGSFKSKAASFIQNLGNGEHSSSWRKVKRLNWTDYWTDYGSSQWQN